MNEPISHHYLPQFYLRQWTGHNGRLFRYHRPHEHTVVSPISPERTGFEERLYSLEGGDDPQIVEKDFFSPLDNAASLILQRLVPLGPGLVPIGPGDFNDKQRIDWTRFVMSLVSRNPHALNEFKAVLNWTARENIERAHGAEYLATKREGDPDSVYEYAIQQTPELADAYKAYLPELIDSPPLGQVIINMQWAVMDLSPPPHTLLTSDRPCVTSHGLGNLACLLGLPISPTRLFVAAHDTRQLEKLAAQALRDTVRNANNLVVRMAVQNVYGSTDSHLTFVDKRLRRPNEPPAPGPMGCV